MELLETSGELATASQHVIGQYEYLLNGFKNEIDTYKSQIDEYKEKSKSKEIQAGALFGMIGAICGALIVAYNTQWKTNTDNFTVIKQEFSEALKDIENRDKQKVINAIRIIERRKDEIFLKEPKRQWLTVVTIARASMHDKSGRTRTNLIGTIITGTNLKDAKLYRAILFNKEGKKLESFERIKNDCYWYRAEYDQEISDTLGQSKVGEIPDTREECTNFRK